MQTIGLDSVAYLRFLRMCRNSKVLSLPTSMIEAHIDTNHVESSLSCTVFLCIGVLCCAVLIPVNVVYNLKNVKAENRNYLLMLTMENVRGDWLWYASVFRLASTTGNLRRSSRKSREA